MNPTDNVIAKAVDGLDDDLKPTEVVDETVKKVEEEKKPGAPETEVDDPKKEKVTTDDKVDDEGFTAADLDEEVVAETKPTEKVETTEVNTEGLSPEAKYIVDNLPYMAARIKDGDSIKEVQVKSWTQLPDDVVFASKRDEMAFMNALTAQENRALSLQNQYQQTQSKQQAQDFEDRENESIQDDITELQKAGELPKFKVKTGDPDFDKDPATQEVQKVLDYMNERNEQYLKEYNQGRPFRHLGFKDAFQLFARTAPTKSSELKKEDKERKEVAGKLGMNRGLTSNEIKKSTVRSGTRIEQILDRIDSEEW